MAQSPAVGLCRLLAALGARVRVPSCTQRQNPERTSSSSWWAEQRSELEPQLTSDTELHYHYELNIRSGG